MKSIKLPQIRHLKGVFDEKFFFGLQPFDKHFEGGTV